MEDKELKSRFEKLKKEIDITIILTLEEAEECLEYLSHQHNERVVSLLYDKIRKSMDAGKSFFIIDYFSKQEFDNDPRNRQSDSK